MRETASYVRAASAGALLAALAVELVAPTVLALTHGDGRDPGHGVQGFISLIVGAVAGGILFVLLDQLINARGGFLRKKATSIAWFSTTKVKRRARLLEDLSKVDILQHIPRDQVRLLVDLVKPVDFHDGELLFAEGAAGDRMYFIREGRLDLLRGNRFFKEMGAGEVLGEPARIGRWMFSTNGVATMGRLGIPTVGFAPGLEELAHTTEERVKIEDLVKATAVYSLVPEALRDRLQRE